MQLVRDKKCLQYLNPGYKYVDYRIRKSEKPKRPFRIAAQRIQKRVNTKEKPKRVDKLVSIQEVDTNRVAVKINGNKGIALIDLQTEGCNLLNVQFIQLFKISIRELKPPLTLMTTIKRFRVLINKAAEIELDWGGHTETITYYVAHLQEKDIIIGKLALQKDKTII